MSRSVRQKPEQNLDPAPTEAELQARRRARIAALAAAQGVRPVQNPEDLVFHEWPEDETADDFLAAIRAWRRGEEPVLPE